jgi:hypothetical protein
MHEQTGNSRSMKSAAVLTVIPRGAKSIAKPLARTATAALVIE